jgi:ribosome biogenesis protein BMS1
MRLAAESGWLSILPSSDRPPAHSSDCLPARLQAAREGAYRATFEDKPLLSDIVFLRAWVQVDLPKLYNPVTNLLAPHALPAPRDPKHRRKQKASELAEAAAVGGSSMQQLLLGGGDGSSAGICPSSMAGEAEVAAAAAAGQFAPANKWQGRRPGFAFKLGRLGLGYYPDHGLSGRKAAGAMVAGGDGGAGAAAAAAAAEAAEADAAAAGGDVSGTGGGGWVPMKSVADLRRALGVGAPRESGEQAGGRVCLRAPAPADCFSTRAVLCLHVTSSALTLHVCTASCIAPRIAADSLYRKIERKPRKFNPLKIPTSLQVRPLWVPPLCLPASLRAVLCIHVLLSACSESPAITCNGPPRRPPHLPP